LTNYEHVEAEVIQLLGNGIDPSQLNIYPLAINTGMLQQHMEMMFYYLNVDVIDVSSTVVPAAIALLDTVKRQRDLSQQLRCFEGLALNFENQSITPFNSTDHLPRLVSVTFEQLHYHLNYDFLDEEEEPEEEMHRRNIRRLYLKIVKVAPDVALQFICSVFSESLTSSSFSQLSFPRAEALLRLIYHYGEALGVKTPAVAEAEGQFSQVLTAIHESDVANHPHWSVVTLYLECAERYWKQLRSEAALGAVLERMCTNLTHENVTLRARASFLLKSMIRHLGPVGMAPFTPRVLTGLQGILLCLISYFFFCFIYTCSYLTSPFLFSSLLTFYFESVFLKT
jgi:hypothetical protein